MKQLLLLLFLTLTTLTAFVLAELPPSCYGNSECGPFAVCYQNRCLCRLGARSLGNYTGCEMFECTYDEHCYFSFSATVCDQTRRLCACKTGYKQNENSQRCDYVGCSRGCCCFSFMYRWLGPLVGFIMLFPITIFLMRVYMMRKVIKSAAREQQQMVATMASLPAQVHNGPNGPSVLHPDVPPPAYSATYSANYQWTQPQQLQTQNQQH